MIYNKKNAFDWDVIEIQDWANLDIILENPQEILDSRS